MCRHPWGAFEWPTRGHLTRGHTRRTLTATCGGCRVVVRRAVLGVPHEQAVVVDAFGFAVGTTDVEISHFVVVVDCV